MFFFLHIQNYSLGFFSSEMFSVRRLSSSIERLVGVRLPEGLVVSVERKLRWRQQHNADLNPSLKFLPRKQ